MKLIIPMAGIGKRLRPFTLTTPKPLFRIAGKTIINRLIEKIIATTSEKITDVGFVIGDFDNSVKKYLNDIGKLFNFNVHIFYQKDALGTAHAIFMAKELLNENVIVAFADTLFKANFQLDTNSDVIIWTKKVSNPQNYGVIIKEDSLITGFYEKPKTFVSDEAIIGIYYFKSAEILKDKLKFLIDNDITGNNEFQLTDALQMMLDDGLKFYSQTVNKWLDCGNKNIILNTLAEVLKSETKNFTSFIKPENTIIIPPVFIGKNVKLKRCIIGPNVAIEDNADLTNVNAKNSIFLQNSKIFNMNLSDTIIGNNSSVIGKQKIYSIGDFNKIEI